MKKKEREELKKKIVLNFLQFIESRPELREDESIKEAYNKLKHDIL